MDDTPARAARRIQFDIRKRRVGWPLTVSLFVTSFGFALAMSSMRRFPGGLDSRTIVWVPLMIAIAYPFAAEAAAGWRPAARFGEAFDAALEAALAAVATTGVTRMLIAALLTGQSGGDATFHDQRALFALAGAGFALRAVIGHYKALRDRRAGTREVTLLYHWTFLALLLADPRHAIMVTFVAVPALIAHAIGIALVMQHAYQGRAAESADVAGRAETVRRERATAGWVERITPASSELRFALRARTAWLAFVAPLALTPFIVVLFANQYDKNPVALTLTCAAWVLWFARDFFPRLAARTAGRYVEVTRDYAAGGWRWFGLRREQWRTSPIETRGFAAGNGSDGLYAVAHSGVQAALPVGTPSPPQSQRLALFLNTETRRLWGDPSERFADV